MPDWARALDRRLARLGVPPTRRVEIVAEVEQHLADSGRSALDPSDADRLVRELAAIERRAPADPPVLGRRRDTFMPTLWQDLRYAARTLRLAPAYSLTVIATLALAIGANAAIFSVADAVMLRPYYPDMDRIVVLNESTRRGDQMSVAWPTFNDWLAQNQSFEHLGVYRMAPATLTGGEQAERVSAAVASSGVFEATGFGPLLGRTLHSEDDRPDAARVVVLSERLWRRRFDADPAVIGRAVVLSGEPHVIVGVMPAAMRFPSRLTDVWLPLGPVIATFPQSRGAHPGLFAVAKLKPGVSFERAVADMDTVARRIEQAHPESNRDVAVQVSRYYDQIVSDIRPMLLMLAGAVGFVLLIGCANLANLMLARTERRQREVAVRAALGADRWRIVQQLLAESLLLAVTGGALGLLLATWMVRAFVASSPVTVPRIDLVAVDGRVAVFAVVLSLIAGIVFGLIPAARASRPDLLSTMKEGARGVALTSKRLRSALVVAEVALALVLLVGAGLMIRSFARLRAVDTGFDPRGVVTLRLAVPAAKYRELDRWTQFHEEVIRRVSALPGVAAAGVNSAVPLEGGAAEAGVFVEGHPLVPGKADAATMFQASSPEYLPAMGIRLVRGRYFTAQDSAAAPPVIIVDESLVRKLFPGTDPLGKRISFESHGGAHGESLSVTWREIVGVVAHVRHYGIASEPPYVQVYTPFEQLPVYFRDRHPAMALMARTTMAPEALAAAIRREVSAVDPDVPIYAVQTMTTYLAQNTEGPRLSMLMLGGLGALALVLALIGIYGVVSYSVAQRTREIGVRMALGASRGSVLRMILRQAAVLIAVGVAIGVAGALAVGSLLRTLLFQVSPRDPQTLAAIAATLAAVALVASVVPARRATRVDPLTALRAE